MTDRELAAAVTKLLAIEDPYAQGALLPRV
jgi:hypothetical protein